MAYKLYGREVFRATVEGREYVFTCYAQDTSYGFRHICTSGYNNTTVCRLVKEDIVSKACYWNRTWESFRYETVLRSAIKKVAPTEEVADKLHAILIDKVAQDEHAETEKFIENFKAIHSSLTQENKDRLTNLVDKLPNGMITTQEQANMINSYATLMSVLQ